MLNPAIPLTPDDLKLAYQAADLRRFRVSYQTAITTPHIRTALRMTAVAIKTKQQGEQHADRNDLPRNHALRAGAGR